MKVKIVKYIKIIVTIAIPCVFLWFLVLSPYLEFKKNEKIMEEAAKDYYELNQNQLPTGKRVSTVTLKELFDSAYIKEDFYLPYSKKSCSVTNSWVKVKQNDKKEYEYYPYLECGILKSSVDHTGPTITLNGDSEITMNRGEEYQELGVKSVKDNTDGKIDIKEVTIDSSKVDTSKNGTYEVKYTALDSLKNKTTVTRKVNVVQKLNVTVQQEATENGIYKGVNVDNYIYFSGILFRIIGLDGDNVKIVANRDIANVNYAGIDKWLDYFYEHLADSSKKLLVKNNYCYGELASEDPNTDISCLSKTKEKYAYILSNKELNESRNEKGESYLFLETISWTAVTSSTTNAWATKTGFPGMASSSQFMSFQRDYNFGIRPVLTVKGSTLIKAGDGSFENPYYMDDIKTGNADEYLNTRYSGEYITYSGQMWRIIETTDDGYTKVIAENPISLLDENDSIAYETEDEIKIYNPNQRGNIGYAINQKTTDTIDDAYFVTKEITVPIYKTLAKYEEEMETKKYKVKFSAPNMYEMFSAAQLGTDLGYWLINSSKEEYRKYLISNIGVVVYEQLSDGYDSHIRPVGYLDKKIKIVSGSGTKQDPYKIAK